VFNRNLAIQAQYFLMMLDPSARRVENGAARHTRDTSFVKITSGSGFGYALRIREYCYGFACSVCLFGEAF